MIDGGLRAEFRKHLPQVHWVSIETGYVTRGVPDCNGCYDGRDFWIEFKVTNSFAVNLAPFQIAWLTRRARMGGSVFVAVRRQVTAGPRRGSAVDELWLMNGAHAADIAAKGLRLLKKGALCGVWHDGPAHWIWDEILAALTN